MGQKNDITYVTLVILCTCTILNDSSLGSRIFFNPTSPYADFAALDTLSPDFLLSDAMIVNTTTTGCHLTDINICRNKLLSL